MGANDQIYRILFNIVALITTVGVIVAYRSTDKPTEFTGSVLGYGLIVLGFGLVINSLMNYDLSAFMGLSKEDKSDELVTTGINQRLRHPLYLGTILAVIGWVTIHPTVATACTAIVTFVYIQIGIYLEEKKLVNQFGVAYEQYQHEVPKLFPMLKK